jgi:hypothetical protein
VACHEEVHFFEQINKSCFLIAKMAKFCNKITTQPAGAIYVIISASYASGARIFHLRKSVKDTGTICEMLKTQ